MTPHIPLVGTGMVVSGSYFFRFFPRPLEMRVVVLVQFQVTPHAQRTGFHGLSSVMAYEMAYHSQSCLVTALNAGVFEDFHGLEGDAGAAWACGPRLILRDVVGERLLVKFELGYEFSLGITLLLSRDVEAVRRGLVEDYVIDFLRGDVLPDGGFSLSNFASP